VEAQDCASSNERAGERGRAGEEANASTSNNLIDDPIRRTSSAPSAQTGSGQQLAAPPWSVRFRHAKQACAGALAAATSTSIPREDLVIGSKIAEGGTSEVRTPLLSLQAQSTRTQIHAQHELGMKGEI
jgi:hypothetical protein